MLQGMLVILLVPLAVKVKIFLLLKPLSVRTRIFLYIPDTPAMRSMGEIRGGTTPFLTSAKRLESGSIEPPAVELQVVIGSLD